MSRRTIFKSDFRSIRISIIEVYIVPVSCSAPGVAEVELGERLGTLLGGADLLVDGVCRVVVGDVAQPMFGGLAGRGLVNAGVLSGVGGVAAGDTTLFFAQLSVLSHFR